MDEIEMVRYMKNLGRELVGLNVLNAESALRYAKEQIEEALKRIEEREKKAARDLSHQNITDEMWNNTGQSEEDANYG